VTSSLLATKLHRPSLPLRRVQRPQLLQRLNEGLAAGRPITLVSAPAGFGKTTCVCDWVYSLELPAAWLSLDSADDDPERFFTYLIAALQRLDKDLGREIEGVLRAGQVPPAEVISTTLINDLLDMESRGVLVLDDFQVIQDPFILQVLGALVAHLPQGLHLVLLTREDPSLPLARLRANSQLTEIRAADLRFAGDATGRFLNEVMGLALSDADIAVLEERTEGWIVGLQLAGFSIRDRANASSYIATLSGTHRHILSYLTEEVLSRQPADIQSFLLQTSILDRLNGDLCNAVTGRADSRALLERLYTDNLFLLPLDDEQHWYRYHHLFADLLRDRQHALQADQTAELHQRASRWYTEAGLAGEAMRHALAAADYTLALRLLEKHAVEMLVQGYAKTVEGWLQAIPPERRLQSPRANLAFVWMHLLHGSFAQIPPYVERLEVMFAQPPWNAAEPSLKAEWLAVRSYLANAQGHVAECLELANQALAMAPETDGYVLSLAYNALGTAYLLQDEYARAIAVYQQAVRHGRDALNPVSEMLATTILVQVTLQHGQYQLAYETAIEGIRRVEASGSQSPVSGVVYGALGQVCYQWRQMEQARDYFLRAIQVSALGGYSDAEVYHHGLFSRWLQAEGHLAAAAQEIKMAVDRMPPTTPAWIKEEAAAQQVRLALAQKQLAAAEAALKPLGFWRQGQMAIPDPVSSASYNFSTGQAYNSALQIVLHQAQARPDPAHWQYGLDLADRLIATALQGQYLPLAIEALLTRAQMHRALGDQPANLADVARALALAKPEGLISLFVEAGPAIAESIGALIQPGAPEAVSQDYIKKILAAFPTSALPGVAPEGQAAPHPPTGSGPAALIEPLSQRELEILRLICEGCSNQAIAERLVLSPHTVKKHSSNIFGKLGVGSRTQAVARTRQLNLLPE
jgi:LuxR family transcriptional regulator, maltose regulon positive regulatory protein